MIKIYYSSKLARLILGKGYSTITLGRWVFTKHGSLSQETINEETTHYLQWRDCALLCLFIALLFVCFKCWWLCLGSICVSPVFYYIVYLIMQIVELCRGIHRMEYLQGFKHWNSQAYKRNSMEREAKENRKCNDYNSKHRVIFEFLKYL